MQYQQGAHGLRSPAGSTATYTCSMMTKLDQTDVVFGLWSGLAQWDYKSRCIAVMSCATLVNTQTHSHTTVSFCLAILFT